jgi:hypothetical protein
MICVEFEKLSNFQDISTSDSVQPDTLINLLSAIDLCFGSWRPAHNHSDNDSYQNIAYHSIEKYDAFSIFRFCFFRFFIEPLYSKALSSVENLIMKAIQNEIAFFAENPVREKASDLSEL